LRGGAGKRGRSAPTVISQIGIEIVAPDGTGDINNDTLVYLTNNAQLAFAFNVGGLPAIFDPTLTYEFIYDSTGTSRDRLRHCQPELPYETFARVGDTLL
jgi:hypothetical protein